MKRGFFLCVSCFAIVHSAVYAIPKVRVDSFLHEFAQQVIVRMVSNNGGVVNPRRVYDVLKQLNIPVERVSSVRTAQNNQYIQVFCRKPVACVATGFGVMAVTETGEVFRAGVYDPQFLAQIYTVSAPAHGARDIAFWLAHQPPEALQDCSICWNSHINIELREKTIPFVVRLTSDQCVTKILLEELVQIEQQNREQALGISCCDLRFSGVRVLEKVPGIMKGRGK